MLGFGFGFGFGLGLGLAPGRRLALHLPLRRHLGRLRLQLLGRLVQLLLVPPRLVRVVRVKVSVRVRIR